MLFVLAEHEALADSTLYPHKRTLGCMLVYGILHQLGDYILRVLHVSSFALRMLD